VTNEAGFSRIRNRVICRVLHEMGLMEEWGSGYQRIVNACKKSGHPEPEWQELGSCVRVIFRSHPEISTHEPVNEPVNELVNERQKWFLAELRRNVPVKAEDIVQRWGISFATAKRDLSGLRKLGLIEFTGAAKTGSYRLKKKTEPSA
jgi:ATP-dependent DNA helicase RecG